MDNFTEEEFEAAKVYKKLLTDLKEVQNKINHNLKEVITINNYHPDRYDHSKPRNLPFEEKIIHLVNFVELTEDKTRKQACRDVIDIILEDKAIEGHALLLRYNKAQMELSKFEYKQIGIEGGE